MDGDKGRNKIASILNIKGVFVEPCATVKPWEMRVRWGRNNKAKRVVEGFGVAPFENTFKAITKEIKSYASPAGQPNCIQLGREAWAWFKSVKQA